MVNNRRPEKNRIHWNHISINGFVFIVVRIQTMVMYIKFDRILCLYYIYDFK